ncbi:MAG: BLUF domain-containing protein [Alphaproteobacteria bacterium]
MIRSLVYISAAARTITDVDIAAILSAADRNNARKQLTGVLLFTGEAFLQVLEGPADQVAAMLDLIRADTRHSNMIVLLDRSIAARQFGDWTMGYNRIDPSVSIDGRRFDLTPAALAARFRGKADAELDQLLRTFSQIELGRDF